MPDTSPFTEHGVGVIDVINSWSISSSVVVTCGLAPLGTRTSTGSMMNTFGRYVYIYIYYIYLYIYIYIWYIYEGGTLERVEMPRLANKWHCIVFVLLCSFVLFGGYFNNKCLHRKLSRNSFSLNSICTNRSGSGSFINYYCICLELISIHTYHYPRSLLIVFHRLPFVMHWISSGLLIIHRLITS